MIVPGSAHALLLSQSGYDIPYSLRFRAANSARLSRTPSSASNRKTYTLSTWVKIGLDSNSSIRQIFTGGDSSTSTSTHVYFYLDKIRWYWGGSGGPEWVTTQVFRDYSAWYHLVFAVDTTQATFDDRLKMYVNGVRVTSWSSQQTGGNTAQNSDTQINSTSAHGIGSNSTAAQYLFDGYMSEINFVDGQQLTPSSFGQTDAATGVWVPKKYSGTYGTNGFYLKFADASAATAAAIGKDSSGNGNNWTPSGISVTSGVTYDQMLDTPTLNYCVLSQINRQSVVTISEASLYQSYSGSANTGVSQGTMAVSSGKWYYEHTVGAIGSFDYYLGVMLASVSPVNNGVNYIYTGTSGSGEYAYRFNGQKGSNGTYTSYGATYAANDVMGVALNLDAGEITFYKNGVSQGVAFTGISGTYAPFCQTYGGGSAYLNFGQRAFSYTPPTGFKALNTANLPTPSIKKGSLYMDATLRTGTGATASVSSLGFQPDFVWIKSRSAATDHGLYDAVRGVQKQIESNTTTAETTETTGLTAFNSNGYTVGALAQLNTSAATYVDWTWKEGATPGFDIVTWTADGTSPRNISHSLGAVPKLIITKQRSPSADNWFTYHASLGATKNVRLDETSAALTQTGAWNNTTPTSSQFTTGNFANFTTNGNSLVAYLWSEIEGFSKISIYTGNGSADGPFVWCGFRPRWLFIKGGDVASSWRQYDTARLTYNEAKSPLYLNTTNTEAAEANGIDILSNGFKIRWSDSVLNGSGSTYIFAAFAENPFKYSRAR